VRRSSYGHATQGAAAHRAAASAPFGRYSAIVAIRCHVAVLQPRKKSCLFALPNGLPPAAHLILAVKHDAGVESPRRASERDVRSGGLRCESQAREAVLNGRASATF